MGWIKIRGGWGSKPTTHCTVLKQPCSECFRDRARQQLSVSGVSGKRERRVGFQKEGLKTWLCKVSVIQAQEAELESTAPT